MKVRLEKELEAVKATDSVIQEHQAVKDVKLLLVGEENEDARILRGIGANSTFVKIEEERGKQIELENLEKEYAGGVFTTAQIEKLALKYRLRFLNSSLFSAHIDVEVSAKIKEFAKKANVDLDTYSLQTRFMILAPAECFNLEIFNFTQKKIERQKEEALRLRQLMLDPLLFYKIDDDKYRLVHKWGNDFSIVRRIEGYKWRNLNTFWTFNFFMLLPVICFLGAWIFSPVFIISHPVWYVAIMLLVNSLMASAFNAGVTDKGWFDEEGGFFSEEAWKSNQKYI